MFRFLFAWLLKGTEISGAHEKGRWQYNQRPLGLKIHWKPENATRPRWLSPSMAARA